LGYYGSDTELTGHYNDELNALALRLLPLCRCVLLYLRLLCGSVGCRGPPPDLDFSKIQIETEDNAMDGNHPKRRKDKYNPYTIGTTEDGRHWLSFSDGQGNRHHFEISAAVFALFDSFELDDLSYLNEVDRHYEQSELTEASLYDRAVHRPATVEESALQSMEYAQLHRAISGLPEIQKRRLILYYFQGLTYERIAEMEGCTKRAVKFSVDIAVEKLKKFFKNF
jgi:RNA polymerase sigma factor (sigma-70 family)